MIGAHKIATDTTTWGPTVTSRQLHLGGPVAGTMWIPRLLVVSSGDGGTPVTGSPFAVVYMGFDTLDFAKQVLTPVHPTGNANSIPFVYNFAVNGADMPMHYYERINVRIGGAPPNGTQFIGVLRYTEIIPAGMEEANTIG